MGALKKVILLIVCIILIIILCLLGLRGFRKKSRIENEELVNEDGKIVLSNEIQNINNLETYSMIKELLNNYVVINSDKDSSKIINVLSKQYIEEKNINKNNLYQKIEEIEQYPLAIINNVKQKDITDNIAYFYVNYDLVNDLSNISNEDLRFESVYTAKNVTERKNNSIIIMVDYNNKTYSVMPQYNEKNEIKNIDNIEENDNNKFELKMLTQQQAADIYIQDFKNKLTYKLQESYNFLNNKYKEKRFISFEAYKDYIEINEKFFKKSILSKYKITEYNNYTEYTCIDQYGNYFIFDEKGVIDYTVKLDTYTVETEEDKNKYISSTDKEKTRINMDKIIQAINRQDYEYLYSKLQNNIKESNFQNIESFEEYIKNNFNKINKFEYGDIDYQNKIGVYEMKITDATGESESETSKNFIITLGEGTEYTFSFNL